MALSITDFIEGIAKLADNENVRVSWKRTALEPALTTGAFTAIGGLFAGPIGLAIGGAIGGITSLIRSKIGKKLSDIIRDLTVEQKLSLYAKIVFTVKIIEGGDGVELLSLIMNKTQLRKAVLDTVGKFIGEQTSYVIQT